MRTAHVLTLIAAAAASFSASAAPSAANNIDTSMNQVAVTASAYHKPTEGDMASLQGSYQLADGRTLRVSSMGTRLYAEVGDTRTEILSVGPNKYASRNDALRLTFDNGDFPVNVLVSTAAVK
ncbi:hypothetical protein GCM10027321_37080 [Massilia terrae]|uniref:Secreted protein n=1 Tax=Massilia terrae TaxID=1811224 RepID=A0ABT2CZ91_9BURK|nr:hypothetical protein [Massilia terrae]MCS0659289.1 hypothetical protein [Massilia terrae]